MIDIKKLALILAVHGFRNSPIEDIHADDRITQEEMKHINKTVYNQIFTILTLLEKGKLEKIPYFMANGWGDNWDEPKFLTEWEKTYENN